MKSTLQRIAEAGIPSDWRLIPVRGKHPLDKAWQQSFKTRTQLEADLRRPDVTGVGLLTGYGLLAIDEDGLSAGQKFNELGGGPKTYSWSSGKPHRQQSLYRVPQGWLKKLEQFTKAVIKTGDGEQLEFRYHGCQSVLPGSWHPEGKFYEWVPGCNPSEVEIADAPEWVLQHIEQHLAKQGNAEKRAAIASNPTLNPWDIRNMARFVEGYKEHGRKGWATCKCPVHGGQSFDSLHINHSSGAIRCQSDCDPKTIYKTVKAIALEAGYQPQVETAATKYRQKIERILGITKAPVAPSDADIVYQPGQLKETLQLAQQMGYKIVLDKSGTGSGKTHQVAKLKPEDFGVDTLFYLSTDSRNVNNPTLKNWPHIEARHDGLSIVDEQGQQRIRRTKDGDIPDIQANCSYPNAIARNRERGLDGSSICGICTHVDKCGKYGGDGFGFRSDRYDALKASRLRVHPDSRPTETEYNYKTTVQILDESGATKSVVKAVLTHADVRILIELTAKDDNQPLLAFLLKIGELMDKQSYHGIAHNELMTELMPLAKAIQILPTGENLDFLKDLRKEHRPSDRALTELLEHYVGAKPLVALIEHLQGGTFTPLSAWIDNGVLTIETRDPVADAINEAAAMNIVLSADMTREGMAAAFNVHPDDVLVIEAESEAKGTLEIVQVVGLGNLTKSSSDESWNRAAATIATIREQVGNIPMLTFKGKERDGDGVHWRDSAGTNALANERELIIVGAPIKNIHSLRSAFILGSGDSEDTEGLQAFIDADTRSTLMQEVGRLRHNRKQGKHRIFLITDFESGLPVNEVIEVGNLNEQCLRKGDAMRRAIATAYNQLLEQGIKPTQQVIADIVECSQQLVSRALQSFTTFPIETFITKVVIPKLTAGEKVKTTVSIATACGEIPVGTLGTVVSKLADGLATVIFGNSPPTLCEIEELEGVAC